VQHLSSLSFPSYDIVFEVEPSLVMKAMDGYWHTFRDLQNVSTLSTLEEEAQLFFTSLGLSRNEMIVDLHYLLQLRYTTLHVQKRKDLNGTRY
jgi:hypothetical protein